uniref:Tumor necrosis factor receptor superfamily member 14 n=1 Tax=Maylandia zebra TaxID=106582 RepID=A0A3P9DI19_9CICH
TDSNMHVWNKHYIHVRVGLGLSCHQGEYQIGNECCPNCLAGNRVKSHCTVESSTSCLPCMTGTYTDQPNGLERCHHCTICDSGSGLRIKTPCTVTSDALCEPLEGFYCVHPTGHSCERAQEHKHCKPGQYISQNGTASTDTECSDCSSGTFSNGTFHSCQQHTQCHSLNLQQITAGTSAADSQCGEKSNHMTLVVIITVIIRALFLFSTFLASRHEATAILFFLPYLVSVLHFRECKAAEPVFMLVSVSKDASFETAFLFFFFFFFFCLSHLVL